MMHLDKASGMGSSVHGVEVKPARKAPPAVKFDRSLPVATAPLI
jgi:hypothetical protein